MHTFHERPILALARAGRAIREVHMTGQFSNGRTKQILGGALLAIGTGVLLVRTSLLALQACNLLRASAPDTAESLAEVGLAVLHGVQIVAFNRTILFSLLSNILVLFSALAVIA